MRAEMSQAINDWREDTHRHVDQQQAAYDKLVVGLSMSALPSSFAFYVHLSASGPLQGLIWLVIAWLCWIIVPILAAAAYYCSMKGHRQALQLADEDDDGDTGYDKAVRLLNPAQLGVFIAGATAFGVFVHIVILGG